ncbi:endonuclease dU [Geoglobus acetivorans]|uniref:UPF0215 protein GACE_1726 n=1 Tax=Geoglobus acetivorans TaxID=565033 RepID=A0A0A7GIL8_GEOAI|nr:hypothetical protein GACE_1726 [Geoglobus acetivorans]
MKRYRFVGFDDSFRNDRASIVGAVTEGNSYLEGVLVDSIAVDGFDVTDRIISMLGRSKFRELVHCIFLSGITFGGFNIADIEAIHERLNMPVVVVMRKRPNFDDIYSALKNVDGFETRKNMIEKAGPVYDAGEVFIQFKGCGLEEAREYLRLASLKGNIPECLRMAHMIASAIIHGENRGRA